MKSWEDYSAELSDSEEGVYAFLSKISKLNYYGYNLFWVENYKKQPGLKNNMWMAINYEGVRLVDDKLTQQIRFFNFEDWDFDYYQNAIIIKSKSGDFIRLTTAIVYPVYLVIQMLTTMRQASLSQ